MHQQSSVLKALIDADVRLEKFSDGYFHGSGDAHATGPVWFLRHPVLQVAWRLSMT